MDYAEIGFLFGLFIAVCEQLKLIEENDNDALVLRADVESIKRRVAYNPAGVSLPEIIHEQLSKILNTLRRSERFIESYLNKRAVHGRSSYDKVKKVFLSLANVNKDKSELDHLISDLENCVKELNVVVTWVNFLDNRERDLIATQRHLELLNAIQRLSIKEQATKRKTEHTIYLFDSAVLSDYIDAVLHEANGVHPLDGIRPCHERLVTISHALSTITEQHPQYPLLKNTLISLCYLINSARYGIYWDPDDFQRQFDNAISIVEMNLNLHYPVIHYLHASTYDRAIQAIQHDDIKTGYDLLIIAVKDPSLRANAAYQLGKYYLYGNRKPNNPVQKDITQEQKWFMIAASAGHFKAAYQLAVNYAYGDPASGYTHDLCKAKTAAARALHLAQHADEVEKAQHLMLLIQRKKYIVKANQGNVSAMFKAAVMFFNMRGVPKSATRESCKQEAIRYAKIAAEHQHCGARAFLQSLSIR